MSLVTALVSRADSWINAMTGLGTLRDKLSYAQVVPGAKLGDGALETLFNEDDIARRVVSKLPREATRRGFRIVLEGDQDEDAQADIARQMDERLALLDAITKLRDSWIWARLYGGGSGIFVGADDGRAPDQPLNESGIRTIAFLNVVKRPQLTIKQRYEDLSSPHFGEPEIYTAQPTTGTASMPGLSVRGGIDIHASRMVLFNGALTAQMTQQTPSGWDDSVLQNGYAPLQQSATAWQSVAHLMTDASQGVLKVANLVDLIASGGEAALRTRIQMMDLARSVCRAILVDAERESFERVPTSFAGLPEVMDRLMMRVASAAEMPVTLLFGRSPAGMNATGESDIRGWYDVVADAQTDVLKPRLERLLRLMFAAKDSPTRGRVPDRWCIEFNPLWQPTEKEVADTKKVKADTYVALVGAQIMTDAEAGIGLAPDFPTINVEHRQELMEADLEEGLRPHEVNTPQPEVDPDDPEGGPDDGGEGGDEPRDDGWDAQTRAPKGSSIGGRWVSTGGGGAAKKKATGARLSDTERESIRGGVAAGTLPGIVAFQRNIAEKYGPGKGGMLAYEREIKTRLKEAKAARSTARTERKAKDEAARKAKEEAEHKAKAEADAKAKAEADAKAEAAVRAKMARTAKASAKAAATRAANKAKKEAEAKAKAEEERNAKDAQKKSGTLPLEHTVEHHAKLLKDKYGETAASTVAWGRAMHERGKSLTLDELGDGIGSLTKHGLPGFEHGQNDDWAIRRVREAQPNIQTVGELATALRNAPTALLKPKTAKLVAARLEGTAAVVAHRRALESTKAARTEAIKLKKPTITAGSTAKESDVVEAIDAANKRYQALSHRDLKQPTEYAFIADSRDRGCQKDRATFGVDEINLGAGGYKTRDGLEKTTIHEWGHALEAVNPKLAQRAGAFLEARTKGESLKHLGSGFGKGEVTRKDGFYDKYMGKEYRHSWSGKRYATEITSMGAENLRSRSAWGDLYRGDPDTAHFTLGQLANQ